MAPLQSSSIATGGLDSQGRAWRPTGCDYLLTLVLFGLSLWSFLPLSRGLSGGTELARVYENGHLTHQFSLNEDRLTTIAGGRMDLEVNRGRIHVARTDCPRRECQHTGWISHAPRTLICAPNRVVVVISAANRSSRRETPDCDAITR
jgi:hypothetical protein